MARRSRSRFVLPELGEKVGRRPARVADNIKQEMAALLLRKIKDPRLDHVTITRVDVTPDLRLARVFFSCREGESDQVLSGLTSARGFIRSHLAKELGMRYVPDLDFRYDESLERQFAMERLLQEIAAEDDKAPE